MFFSDPSRRIYERFTFSPQTFLGGTRNDIRAVVRVRATHQFSAELQYLRNDVDLPGGNFDVKLAILGLDYAISPNATLRSLLQYNSTTDDLVPAYALTTAINRTATSLSLTMSWSIWAWGTSSRTVDW